MQSTDETLKEENDKFHNELCIVKQYDDNLLHECDQILITKLNDKNMNESTFGVCFYRTTSSKRLVHN